MKTETEESPERNGSEANRCELRPLKITGSVMQVSVKEFVADASCHK